MGIKEGGGGGGGERLIGLIGDNSGTISVNNPYKEMLWPVIRPGLYKER